MNVQAAAAVYGASNILQNSADLLNVIPCHSECLAMVAKRFQRLHWACRLALTTNRARREVPSAAPRPQGARRSTRTHTGRPGCRTGRVRMRRFRGALPSCGNQAHAAHVVQALRQLRLNPNKCLKSMG
jgi:hypothetical protein